MKFLNCIRRVARNLRELRPYIVYKCDKFMYLTQNGLFAVYSIKAKTSCVYTEHTETLL